MLSILLPPASLQRDQRGVYPSAQLMRAGELPMPCSTRSQFAIGLCVQSAIAVACLTIWSLLCLALSSITALRCIRWGVGRVQTCAQATNRAGGCAERCVAPATFE